MSTLTSEVASLATQVNLEKTERRQERDRERA